jgi:hypothetical protein
MEGDNIPIWSDEAGGAEQKDHGGGWRGGNLVFIWER